MKFLLLMTLLFSGLALSQDDPEITKDAKVIYKYRKHEKFDFDDIDVGGQNTSTGDLSITPRSQRDFENKLPYRKNFNPEIRRAVNNIM